MLIGAMAREHDIPNRIRYRDLILPITLVVYAYLTNRSWVNMVCADANDYVIGPVCTIIIVLVLSKICLQVSHMPILTWFGRNSLIILCTHLFALNCMSGIVHDFFPTFPHGRMLMYSIWLGFPIVVTWMIVNGRRCLRSVNTRTA